MYDSQVTLYVTAPSNMLSATLVARNLVTVMYVEHVGAKLTIFKTVL